MAWNPTEPDPRPQQPSSAQSHERLSMLEGPMAFLKTPTGIAAIFAVLMSLYSAYQQYQKSQGQEVNASVKEAVEWMKTNQPKAAPQSDEDVKAKVKELQKQIDIIQGGGKKQAKAEALPIMLASMPTLVSEEQGPGMIQDRVKALEDTMPKVFSELAAQKSITDNLIEERDDLKRRLAACEKTQKATSQSVWQPAVTDTWGRTVSPGRWVSGDAVQAQPQSTMQIMDFSSGGSCSSGSCSSGRGFFRRR